MRLLLSSFERGVDLPCSVDQRSGVVLARPFGDIGGQRMVHQRHRGYAGLLGFVLVGVAAFDCSSSDQSGATQAGGTCTTSQDCAGQPCVGGVCQGATAGAGGSTSDGG